MSCKSLFKLKQIHQFCQYICINLNLSIKPTWINRLYYQLFSFISGQVRVSWRFSESKTHDIVDSISVILQDMFHNLVIRSARLTERNILACFYTWNILSFTDKIVLTLNTLSSKDFHEVMYVYFSIFHVELKLPRWQQTIEKVLATLIANVNLHNKTKSTQFSRTSQLKAK